jgi:hypothetical protein
MKEATMKRLFAGATCLACTLAFSIVTLAQSAPPTQPPATQPPAAQTPPPAAQDAKAAAQQVTIIGCVQKEADYRQAKNLGKGGAVGTGAGARDEFVLVSASMAPASATEPAPTGTAGAGNQEFEVTGKNEEQLGSFVGKRVEITGKLKAAETKATGAPTGGATAAVPGSSDLKLRELEIVSVKESTGTCPAVK